MIRDYVKGRQGVYALYKGTRLYYVGLASNLRSRLRAHVKDRHANAWDFFSMYLTVEEEHLRELEALVLRITMPSGNRSKTKFSKSQDLRAMPGANRRSVRTSVGGCRCDGRTRSACTEPPHALTVPSVSSGRPSTLRPLRLPRSPIEP